MTRPRITGAEHLEAIRLSRLLVKEWIRGQDKKVGSFTVKEIREMSKELLEKNYDAIVKQAKENLAERHKIVKGDIIYP